MTKLNPHLAADIAGIQSPITFTGTNKQKIAQLRVLVSREESDEVDQRGWLDEMSPAARITLVRILTDLEASVENAA